MSPKLLVALVHYQTPDLLEQAVESFRVCYPDQDVLILDNGSSDGSDRMVRDLAAANSPVRARCLPQNLFHGPAMDLVLREASEDLVFFLDTDTVTRRSGFLEEMAALIAADHVLAVGHVVQVDGRGFAASKGVPVPASAYMLVHRERYLGLPPFIHHGLPVLKTCQAAARRGLTIESYPIENYVDHLGRGTAARFGYGLGFRSRLSYLLHRLGL